MVLTKRPQNIERLLYGVTEECGCRELGGGDYLSNSWLGVSVENQRTADKRIPILLQIPAAKRFVSCEPLLSEIDFRFTRGDYRGGWLNALDWCIVGGETGPKARPMNPDWVRSLRDQCQTAGVPFFFKGMMITRGYEKIPHKTYLLDGKEWREFPKQEVIKNE
jgi:protein gp37